MAEGGEPEISTKELNKLVNELKISEKRGSDEISSAYLKLNFGVDSIEKLDLEKIRKETERMKRENICKVCRDNQTNIVLLPCGHLAVCKNCAPALRVCVICRSGIRGTVNTYRD